MPLPKHSALAQQWVHSREEDAAGLQVFRPATYPFPPARGRDSLGLEHDGTLRNTIPGPDDRPSTQSSGSWILQGDTLVLQSGSGTRKAYAIESVGPDKLLLRPL